MIRIATLVFAFFAPPALAGVATLYSRMHGAEALDPLAAGNVPGPPRPPITQRRLAIIVAGNRGTEITDSLPIIETLEESGEFEVRVVAPERVISPFKSSAIAASGVDFVPDMSFAEYEELVGHEPDLVVVPFLTAWQSEDAAVVPWIRAHVGENTLLMSICAGAEVVAATGLFAGREATAHYGQFDRLRSEHPEIHYRRDVRWVRDGNRISSGAFTAGIDATLAAIDSLAGREAALRAATAMSYSHVEYLDDPAAPMSHDRGGLILEMAFRWERSSVAVVIADNVSESAVAALLDTYAATLTTDSVAVAMDRTPIRTRHGLRLIPHDTTAHLADYAFISFATRLDAGLSSYDAALAEVARSHGSPMARAVARLMNAPAANDGDFRGGIPVGFSMLLRVVVLGLAGMAAVQAFRSLRAVPDCNARPLPAS